MGMFAGGSRCSAVWRWELGRVRGVFGSCGGMGCRRFWEGGGIRSCRGWCRLRVRVDQLVATKGIGRDT